MAMRLFVLVLCLAASTVVRAAEQQADVVAYCKRHVHPRAFVEVSSNSRLSCSIKQAETSTKRSTAVEPKDVCRNQHGTSRFRIQGKQLFCLAGDPAPDRSQAAAQIDLEKHCRDKHGRAAKLIHRDQDKAPMCLFATGPASQQMHLINLRKLCPDGRGKLSSDGKALSCFPAGQRTAGLSEDRKQPSIGGDPEQPGGAPPPVNDPGRRGDGRKTAPIGSNKLGGEKETETSNIGDQKRDGDDDGGDVIRRNPDGPGPRPDPGDQQETDRRGTPPSDVVNPQGRPQQPSCKDLASINDPDPVVRRGLELVCTWYEQQTISGPLDDCGCYRNFVAGAQRGRIWSFRADYSCGSQTNPLVPATPTACARISGGQTVMPHPLTGKTSGKIDFCWAHLRAAMGLKSFWIINWQPKRPGRNRLHWRDIVDKFVVIHRWDGSQQTCFYFPWEKFICHVDALKDLRDPNVCGVKETTEVFEFR